MSTINEEDSDLEEGFGSALPSQSNDSLGDDPAPAAQPSQASAEPAAKDPKPEEEIVDPLAELPQPVRDMLADYQRMRVEFDGLKRTAGQVPALQARLDKMATAAPPPPAEAAPRRKLEKVEALRAQGLPEIADALEELSAALPETKAPPTASEPEKKASPPADNANVDMQTEMLDEIRPGWADTVFSNDYSLWLASQPAEFSQKVRTASKASVILDSLTKFDQWKARTQITQQAASDRQRRMAAAVTPRGDGRALARTHQVDDEDADLEAGFNKPGF